MRIKFSETEIIDLLWAWAAISFAFAVILRRTGYDFVMLLVVAGLTVGAGFVLHELAHKFMAQKYGCWAEFKKWNFGLILAVIMSFVGFIFAAPGAVVIGGMVSREQNGRIAASGALANLFLAVLFLAAAQIIGPTTSLINMILVYGFVINAWLALFNMIPFPPLDGSKVIAWSFPTWLAIVVVAAFMVFI